MVQRSPIYTPDAASETIHYKPLSLMAVAGFLLAAAYVLIIAIGGVASFFKSEPFFLGGWSIALPIGGAVLSGLALWQILSSEGTRAGAGLAKWGLGICVVTCLGYLTYQEFTGLAIVQQANRFLMEKDEQSGFFPRLQGNEADVFTAFALSLDVADRGAANPRELETLDMPLGNSAKGRFTLFLENPLVHLVRFSRPTPAKIEPLAVRTWTYEEGAYRIVRTYRIETAEGVFNVSMMVSSIEPNAAGEKRRWKVEAVPPNAMAVESRTEFGVKCLQLRQKSAEFLGDPALGWLAKLRNRDDLEVYLRTQPFAKRKDLRQLATTIRSQTPLVALVGPVMPTSEAVVEGFLLKKLLPGYHPLDQAFDYFSMDSLRVWDPAYLASVKEGARAFLSRKGLPHLNFRVTPDDFALVDITGGEAQVTHQAEIRVGVVGPKNAKGEQAAGEVLLLVKAIVAAPDDVNPATAAAGQQWYVKSAEITRGFPIRRE
jgi:hypothetical protein